VAQQEEYLNRQTSEAANLPTSKARQRQYAQKRRKVEAEAVKVRKGKREADGAVREEERAGVVEEPENPHERVKAYIDEVRKMLAESEEGQTGKGQERRLGRVLGDAVGRIGRERWEEARRGRGKLAWGKIPVRILELSLRLVSKLSADDGLARDTQARRSGFDFRKQRKHTIRIALDAESTASTRHFQPALRQR
jgi:hypothetical protein